MIKLYFLIISMKVSSFLKVCTLDLYDKESIATVAYFYLAAKVCKLQRVKG